MMVTKKKVTSEKVETPVASVIGTVTVIAPEPTTVSASDAIQSVSLHYGGDIVRTLKVTLTGSKPSFEFNGIWGGAQVKVVARHLARAYNKYRLTMRREGIATFNQGGNENA
jgi:hypothetical protein